MKPSELLNSPEKWYHKSKNPDGCACIWSSLWDCCDHYGPEYSRAMTMLADHLGLVITAEGSGACFWPWNDAPERTYGEVIAALKACDL